MLLDIIAHDWAVQAIFIVALGAAYVATLINRRVSKAQEDEREDKRASRAVVVRTNQ